MNRPILDNVLPTLLGPVRALLDKKADKKEVAAKLGEKADAAEVEKQLSEKANADEIVKTVNGLKPDESGNIDVSGLPEGAAAHQQLVTDETGAAKWEARTHYVAPDGTVHPLDAKFIPETIARTADVNAAISALGSVLRFKGAVATVDLLPTEGNELGDVYYVTEGSSGYAWIQDADGTQRWEQLGPMISGEFLPTGATAYQQLVTDGEGKAKWEDKAFYKKVTNKTILNTQVNISYISDVDIYRGTVTGEYPELVSGSEYSVRWNDETIDGVVAVYDDIVSGPVLTVNFSSGTVSIKYTSRYLVDGYEAGTFELEISQVDVEVKKIDSAYLPELPELPEGFSGSWNDLTEKPFGEIAGTKTTTIFSETIESANTDVQKPWNYSEIFNCKSVFVYYNGVPDQYDVVVTEESNPFVGDYTNFVIGDTNLSDSPFYISGSDSGGLSYVYVKVRDANASIRVDVDAPYYTTVPEEFLPTTVPVIQSATVGQTVVVKAVDESGKPTEWEAVDAAEISNYLVITGKAPAASATDLDYSTFEYSANLSFDYAAKLIRAGQLAGVAVNLIATFEDPESGAYEVETRPIGVVAYVLGGNANEDGIVIVTGGDAMADMYNHPYPFTSQQRFKFTRDGVQLVVPS